MTCRLVALTAATLPQLAELLGSPAFGGCFCAVWCHHGPDWSARCADADRPNLAATSADVRAGRRAGYLVELDGQVVAWTGAGPREHFGALQARLGGRLWRGEGAWVVGCLAIAPAHRGHGLSERIVSAVCDRARAGGASWVDAFPTRPWDEPRSYRGSLSMYARLGFEEQAAEADGRSEIVWMRKTL